MRSSLVSLAFSLAATGCLTELPEVPKEAFACEDNQTLVEGEPPCPLTHRCSDGFCRPRFDCREPGQDAPGCAPGLQRCSLRSDGVTAGVVCENGVHTGTSTVPTDVEACACPDGLWCAALAELGSGAPKEAYGLFVFAQERRPARLQVGSLGIEGERPFGRLCVRACGTEADCSANHTCRAAVLLRPDPPALDGRQTVGVCYPTVLSTTTTVADQPDPLACNSVGDCTVSQGRAGGLCQAQVIEVPDHPTVPAQDAWGSHRAIVARCVADVGGALRPDGQGCIGGNDCQSGICLRQRCVRLCDPARADGCGGGRQCLDNVVERNIPGGQTVVDRLFLCGG